MARFYKTLADLFRTRKNDETQVNVSNDSLSFVYDAASATYIDSKGVQFSDDKKTLIHCPKNLYGEYTIPYGVVVIKQWAFAACRELTSIKIPDSVTKIECQAFENCSSLQAVNIPDNITQIEMGTFAGCEMLEKILIPKNVEIIESHAFGDIGTTLIFDVDKQNAKYCSDEYGNLYTKDKSILIHACHKITNTLIIPEGVKVIKCCSFQWAYFTMVSLPKSIEKIEPEAFLSANIRYIYIHHINPNEIKVAADSFEDCAERCILYIPEEAYTIEYSYHIVFKQFRSRLFWKIGEYYL